MVPTVIQELTEENLNPDEEPQDWKWNEMSRAVNARYGLKTSERELKKIRAAGTHPATGSASGGFGCAQSISPKGNTT